MNKIGFQAGWVLVYTSAIMFGLRFFAGPISHKFSSPGLLAICSGVAAVGLYMMSFSSGSMILLAATVYGLGKSFFGRLCWAWYQSVFQKAAHLR
ncbi:hypothetical protein [Mucilaginibacter antarcticus]|uniref:hypothetical protein n=1 Tax=Mucilaginibacter antarcticus TaxID=1855725 RepID=UPI00362A999D